MLYNGQILHDQGSSCRLQLQEQVTPEYVEIASTLEKLHGTLKVSLNTLEAFQSRNAATIFNTGWYLLFTRSISLSSTISEDAL